MNPGVKQMNGSGTAGVNPARRFFQNTGLGGRSVPREDGMTALGIIILVIFIGLFAFSGLRLTPIYLNYMKVAGVLDGTYKEFDSQSPSRSAIRRSIQRRFDVESVSVITARDIKVTADSGGFLVEAVYDHTVPFIGNIYFTVKFDERVTIRR
jgi:hypothetical protein